MLIVTWKHQSLIQQVKKIQILYFTINMGKKYQSLHIYHVAGGLFYSKKYAILFTAAYKHADGKKIDGRRVLVDVERARTVKGWLPRKLGK